MGIETIDATAVSGDTTPKITAPYIPPEYEGDEVIPDCEDEEEDEGGDEDE